MDVAAGNAIRFARDDEGTNAAVGRLRFGVRAREDEEVVRFGRQADPRFLAAEEVGIAITAGAGLEIGGIAADAGFGEAIGGDALAAGLGGQDSPLLFFCAPLQQRHVVQAHVHGHHHAQGGIAAFQLFADEAEREVIEALAAIAHGDVDAEDTQLGQARQDALVHSLLAVPTSDVGDDFLIYEIAHQLLGGELLFVQSEIHCFAFVIYWACGAAWHGPHYNLPIAKW